MPESSLTTPDTSGSSRRIVSTILVSFLIVAVVWFVSRRLGASFDEVSDTLADASRPILLVAFVTAALAMTLIATGWIDFLRREGAATPGGRVVGWYFVGEITKYLPGGLWAFVGRGELAATEINRRPAYRTVTHSLLVFFALATIPSAGALVLYTDWPTGIRIVGAAGLLTVYPAFISVFGVRGRSLLITTANYGAAWLMIGLTTRVIAEAVGADIGMIEAVLITAAAWLAGFAVFFVPGGIGIRESVFVVLTADILNQNDALAIAIIARIAFILADSLGAAVGLLVQRRYGSLPNHREGPANPEDSASTIPEC